MITESTVRGSVTAMAGPVTAVASSEAAAEAAAMAMAMAGAILVAVVLAAAAWEAVLTEEMRRQADQKGQIGLRTRRRDHFRGGLQRKM